jgi:hypothetical protein
MRGSEAIEEGPDGVARLYALARVSATNALMDVARQAVRQRQRVDANADPLNVQDGAALPDRRVDAAAALEVILDVLADASSEDRELFLRLVGELGPTGVPLDARQRQRALRLRTTMIKELQRKFGDDVLELVKADSK